MKNVRLTAFIIRRLEFRPICLRYCAVSCIFVLKALNVLIFKQFFCGLFIFIIKSLLKHWGFSFVNLAAVRRLIFFVLFLALGVLHWMCRCLVILFIPPYHNPNNICCIYILYLTHSPVQFFQQYSIHLLFPALLLGTSSRFGSLHPCITSSCLNGYNFA